MATRDKESEEIRTSNATEGLMYGNRDTKKAFAFDVRSRFEYLVYTEKLGRTEDGQIYSKKTTQKYQFFKPSVWESLIKSVSRKNYFERLGMKYTILHDPFTQAKLEGKELKGDWSKKTGLSLEERMSKVKNAEDFAVGGEVLPTLPISDLIEADEIEIIQDPSPEDIKLTKKPARRK